MKQKLILLLFLPLLAVTQNPKKDIAAVARYFTTLNNYSMNMHYMLYLDNKLAAPFQERSLQVKRFGKNMMIHYDKMVVLDNERFQVIVDHDEKTLMTRKKVESDNSVEDLNEWGSFMEFKADSIFYMYEAIKVISDTKDVTVYELTFKPNEKTEKITVTINKKLKYFENVVIKYKQAMKINELDGKYHSITLKICYEQFKPNSEKNTNEFSEKNYLEINKNGKITAAKKYSGYKVISPETEG
jgi:hypothetical protein